MTGKTVSPEPSWSTSLMFLAAEEAARSLHGAIEPVHLVIALSRLTDAAVQEPTQAELTSLQHLRAEFEALGIAPRQFRRRLRAIIPTGGQADAADRLKTAIAQGASAR